ncbi:MAG TPA: carboxypeptidase-like regulatory domain-containing protein [Bacteroidales bacterium]|nr:carboxypeptidase-like regulatory domain-containing protein [Bacteroidales bacterium]
MKRFASFIISGILCVSMLASEKPSANVKAESKVENALISGVVVDKITGEPLAGVEVKMIGSNEKVFTDFDGNFQFTNIPQGAYAIKIDYISYENVVENVYATKEENPIKVKLSSVK